MSQHYQSSQIAGGCEDPQYRIMGYQAYNTISRYGVMLQGLPGPQCDVMLRCEVALPCDVTRLTRLIALLRSLSLSLELDQVCIKQQAPAEHARPNLDGAWHCCAG